MITLLIQLIILGVIFYFAEQIPMASPFPQIVRVVALVIGLVIILQFFGVYTGLPALR